MYRVLAASFFGLVVGCSSTAAPSADASPPDTGEEPDTSPVDTGTADTGSPDPWDGGPPSAECVAHCTCMTDQCSKLSGYPYTSEKACTDRCGRFSAAELKCWSFFCNRAKTETGSTKGHTCQHAWGTLGLEECPK